MLIKKIINDVSIMFGFLSLALLLSPTTFLGIAIFLCGGFISGAIFILISKSVHLEDFRILKVFVLELLLVMLVVHDFYNYWIASSRISNLSKVFHMSADCFLWILAGVLGLLSLRAIHRITLVVVIILHKVIVMENLTRPESIKNMVYILLVLFLENLQLNYSVVSSLDKFLGQGISVIIINYFLVILLNLILLLCLQSWKVVLFISTCFFTVWSVANYYVIEFHGSPLFPLTLYNSGKTGIMMAEAYHYSLNITVICVLTISMINLIFIFSLEKHNNFLHFWQKLCIRFSSTAIVCALIVVAFMGKGGVLPAEGSKESWTRKITVYGFMVSSVWDIKNHDQWLIKPEGYATGEVTAINIFKNDNNILQKDYPDIIFILNESFCDVDVYADLKPDRAYLSDFYSVDGAVYGYAISPSIGGGTNNSEFEVLTSKSTGLLTISAPFTYLTRDLESRNVVQYLHSLGYKASAMHCGPKTNYARNTAYPAAGFDHVYLGADDFSYNRKNGNRSWLDTDNFHDLIDRYESCGDGPQFFFLLTIQNHGGYEQNDSSLDTVHIMADYGNLTDDINEYLSSVELSGKAFKEVTDYYAVSERPVIICMVGDHAPSFINSLEMDGDCPFQVPEIGKRIVPYAMWSNYGIDFSNDFDYVSMTDLIPLILKAAEMPLSTFYNEISELHKNLPIRTSDGLCVDTEGRVGSIKDSRYKKLVQRYYSMEYNSLLTSDEYREELFMPNRQYVFD